MEDFISHYSSINKIKGSSSSYIVSYLNDDEFYYLKIIKEILNNNEECKLLFKNYIVLKTLQTQFQYNNRNMALVNNSFNFLIVNNLYTIDNNKNNLGGDVLIEYELCNSSLRHSVKTLNKSIKMNSNEEIIMFIFYQLICCLESLDSLSIVHLNLNLDNIFINKNGLIKISDFQHSIKSGIEISNLKEYNSKRFYKSPELLLNSSYITTSSDTWSIGCIIYEIFYNKILFDCNSTIEHIIKIVNLLGTIEENDIKSIPLAEGYISNVFLISGKNYTKDKWKSENKDLENKETDNLGNNLKINELIRKMLVFNPSKRPSIEELKLFFKLNYSEIVVKYDNIVKEWNNSDYQNQASQENSGDISKSNESTKVSNESIENTVNYDQEITIIKQSLFWNEVNININKHNEVINYKEKIVKESSG